MFKDKQSEKKLPIVENLSPKEPIELISDMTLNRRPNLMVKLDEALMKTDFQGEPVKVQDVYDKGIRFHFTLIKTTLIKNKSYRFLLNIPESFFILTGFRTVRAPIEAIDSVREAIWMAYGHDEAWNKKIYIIRPSGIDIHRSVVRLFRKIWKRRAEGLAKIIEITEFEDEDDILYALDIKKEKKKPKFKIKSKCSEFLTELKSVSRRADLRSINDVFHKFRMCFDEELDQYKSNKGIFDDLKKKFADLVKEENKINNWMISYDKYVDNHNEQGQRNALDSMKNIYSLKVKPLIKTIEKLTNTFESKKG